METPAERHREKPRLVEMLDLEVLPRGQITRLLVELAHDALGRAERAPVLVARGERAGPVVGITAAVHGNELNGIRVIHRLMERVDTSQLKGTIVGLVVTNVPGFLGARRMFGERTDLNHIMPGIPDSSAPRVYAHRLFDRIISRFEYLMDLHTASTGRINSLYVRADLENPVTRKMAMLQRPQIIVHDPPSDGTLRGAAMAHGVPAVTVEIGNPSRFQASYVKQSLAGIRRVLSWLGMISKRPLGETPVPVMCGRSKWLYTDHGGLLDVLPNVTDMVEEEEVVARLYDVFGELISEYRAPCAGVVIGKSVDPVARTGARILHLGIPSEVIHPEPVPPDAEDY